MEEAEHVVRAVVVAIGARGDLRRPELVQEGLAGRIRDTETEQRIARELGGRVCVPQKPGRSEPVDPSQSLGTRDHLLP